VALSGDGEVVASHGFRLAVSHRLESDANLVIVPGGAWNAQPGTPGARAEVQHSLLPPAIATTHRQGTTIPSVDTGDMIVAGAGRLHGRPSASHHEALDDLARSRSLPVDARVVDAGDVITAAGVTCINMEQWLVEREWGAEIPQEVASEIEHDRAGTVWMGPT
jgi:transcriptional regulator GlxA family with amidase domain